MEDAEAISALVNSAYRGESSKRGWTTEADLIGGQRTDPEILRALIADQQNSVLVRYKDGVLVACVFLQKKGTRAYLGMLTVRPDHQAGGIGKQLLSAAEEWAKDNWKVDTIEMTVIQKRVELISWYERRGYINTRRTQPFPYGDARFGLPKVDDLEFVVLEKSVL